MSASAIRYYERAGLIRPPARHAGWRDYGAEALGELALIRRAREAGLGIGELRRLVMALSPAGSDARQILCAIADAKLIELDRRIERATALRARISAWRDCGCDNPRDCLPTAA